MKEKEPSKEEMEKVSTSDFIEENHKLISTLAFFTALTVFAGNLPLKPLGYLLSFLAWLASVLIWCELTGKFPQRERWNATLIPFALTLSFIGIIAQVYCLIEFATIWSRLLYPILLITAAIVIGAVLLLLLKVFPRFSRIMLPGHKRTKARFWFLYVLLLVLVGVALSITLPQLSRVLVNLRRNMEGQNTPPEHVQQSLPILSAPTQTINVPAKATNLVGNLQPSVVAKSAAGPETNAFQIRLDAETRNILDEATKDKWFKKDAFTSTVLGGALAIFAGFVATLLAYYLQAQAKKSEDIEFARRVLRAFRCELEACSKLYDNGIGKNIPQMETGSYLTHRLFVSQSYFTIFETNASNIGRITPHLSKSIIEVYHLMKVQIDMLRINNAYLDQLDVLNEKIRDFQCGASLTGELPSAVASPGSFLQQRLAETLMRRNEQFKTMINHAEFLKANGLILKKAYTGLLSILDDEGIK